ncbi:hypothetical protein J4G37_21055 [Microvirga sp. 3-52]|nr:hypothetical protein [Microvirga sp. 3-52]
MVAATAPEAILPNRPRAPVGSAEALVNAATLKREAACAVILASLLP